MNLGKKLINLLAGAALAASFLVGAGTPASAAPVPIASIGFKNIWVKYNSASYAAIGEAQFKVNITCDKALASAQVAMTFTNNGLVDFSLTEIHLDDEALLQWYGLVDRDENGGNAGVDFSRYASPKELTGGEFAVPPFVSTYELSADSDEGSWAKLVANGINPGESLVVKYSLLSGRTCNTVASDLARDPARLRVGVKGVAANGTYQASFVNPLAPDAAVPYCVLSQKISGPPAKLVVHVQDIESGVQSIKATKSNNLMLAVTQPDDGSFTGTFSSDTYPSLTANVDKDLFVITATKVDQALAAQLYLRVTDMAGNVIDCDPVLTTEERGTGRPVHSERFELAKTERWVQIENGVPGISNLKLNVNGKVFVAAVRHGETKKLDIGAALVDGTNYVILTSYGAPGSTAEVMIWDGVTAGGN